MKTYPFQDFWTFVDNQDWSCPEMAVTIAANCLKSFGPEHLMSMVREELVTMRRERLANLGEGSRETSTHYKLLLVGGREGPRIWLHLYKEFDSLRPGYGNSIHDHRYSFCSTVLSGGFTHCVHPVLVATGDLFRLGAEERYGMNAGEVYMVDHRTFHSLAEIQPNTLTLLVEGPQQKPISHEYRNGRLIEHVPVELVYQQFRDRFNDQFPVLP